MTTCTCPLSSTAGAGVRHHAPTCPLALDVVALTITNAQGETRQEWTERRLAEAFDNGATAVAAEGARVGFKTCRICGAAVLLDPRDEDVLDALMRHRDWHRRLAEDDNEQRTLEANYRAQVNSPLDPRSRPKADS